LVGANQNSGTKGKKEMVNEGRREKKRSQGGEEACSKKKNANAKVVVRTDVCVIVRIVVEGR
jgi:hypothetical protein